MSSSLTDLGLDPELDIGEEDIIVEDGWLDRGWFEIIDATARDAVASAADIDGLLLAAALADEDGDLASDPRDGRPADHLPDLVDLWRSSRALAEVAGEPLEELMVRSGSTLLACRRITGTRTVLCALVDRARTNDAVLRLTLAKLCG